MKEETPLQELLERLKRLQNNNYDDAGIRTAISISNQLLAKEKQVIVDAVNETIDGYVYFTESTHNPPPMNGEDYYNNKYTK